MSNRPYTTLLVAAMLLAKPTLSAAQGTAPGREWRRATPAALGMNAAVFDSLDREIKSGQYGLVDRLLVIRHGQIAFDGRYTQDYDKVYRDSARVPSALNAHDNTGPYNYFNPWWHPFYRRGDLHSLQSVTKTVASVVFGVALTRGDFPSIDTPVLKFFDTTKVANIDDRKRRMTVRQNPDGTSAYLVENYLIQAGPAYVYSPLNLEAAIVRDQRWLLGYNTIEFSPGPNGGVSFAKFFNFNAKTGQRDITVDLDGRGAPAQRLGS